MHFLWLGKNLIHMCQILNKFLTAVDLWCLKLFYWCFDAEWILECGLKTAETIIINGMLFLAAQQRYVILTKTLQPCMLQWQVLICLFSLWRFDFVALKKAQLAVHCFPLIIFLYRFTLVHGQQSLSHLIMLEYGTLGWRTWIDGI